MASPKLLRSATGSFGASFLLLSIFLSIHYIYCSADKFTGHFGHLSDYITYYEPVIRIGFPLHNFKSRNSRTDILFSFRAFGREFHLKLRTGSPLLAANALVITHDGNGTKNTIPASYLLQRLVNGVVKGEKYSHVQGHVVRGTFEGIITLKDEIYYIEPWTTYLPIIDSRAFDSLIYRRSDINITALICATGDCLPFRLDFKRGPKISDEELAMMEQVEGAPVESFTRKESGTKQQKQRRKICTVKLVADHTFYQKATDQSIEVSIHEMIVLVTAADNIFRSTDFDYDGRPDGIGFQVSSVVVWKSQDDANYQMFREDLSSEDFLSAFALHDSSDVCMAICFVHRVFSGNVLGLAYTASVKRNHAGGICQKRISSRPPRSYNAAVVTVEGSSGRMPRALNSLTLTHELGHSFGSDHDQKSERCSPRSIKGGSYLMADTIENSNQSNNNKFSPCSIDSIARVLAIKAKCFLAQDELGQFVCGNAIREKGEQCDCGHKEQCHETDMCCVPKGGLKNQQECQLINTAQCSPRNGPCCTQDCTLVAADDKMLCSNNECMKNEFCNGVDSLCPTPVSKADGSVCNNGFGVCIRGQCNDKTCSQFQLQECLCVGWRYGCNICCIRNGLCVPASRLRLKPRSKFRLWQADGVGCNFGQGICKSGKCKANDYFGNARLDNRNQTEEEDEQTEGLSILATLLGTALIIVFFVVVMLLIYFLTPLRSWILK
uniref:Peptidase M12B domain-containing protein n=1 Tax=Strigamia maritima TaxID=126957 RepID=T1IKY2_STRMM